jgi:PAS domain S-box-containing protein
MTTTETLIDCATATRLVGSFEVRHDTGDLIWSPELKAIFGLGLDAPCEFEIFWRLVFRADRKAVISAIAGSLTSNQPHSFALEFRIHRPDGGVRWLRMLSRTFFKERAESAVPLCTVGVMSDVTRRVETERNALFAALVHLHRERQETFREPTGHRKRRPEASPDMFANVSLEAGFRPAAIL